jgi:hypothetical protein
MHTRISDTARNSEAAKALGLPETAKWNDILDVVFCAEPDLASLRNLISAVGSIPSDLYTKKKFKNLSPEVLASTCTAIRALEQQMPNDAIQYERSTFLNHVFRSRNAEKFKQLGRTSVTLDSNGMFVQFRGIQSHIPYGLIDLETIDALSAGKWLSESDIIELKVRRAEEAVDTLGFCTAKIEQLHATARIFNIAEHEQSDVQELLRMIRTHLLRRSSSRVLSSLTSLLIT